MASLGFCRGDRPIEANPILHIVSEKGCVRACCETEIICCRDVIPQLNHWLRIAANHVRCAAGCHPHQPWGRPNTKPDCILCFFSAVGVNHIRAEVPNQANEPKLVMIKLMLAETTSWPSSMVPHHSRAYGATPTTHAVFSLPVTQSTARRSTWQCRSLASHSSKPKPASRARPSGTSSH